MKKNDSILALWGIQKARIQRHTLQERAGAGAHACTRASKQKTREDTLFRLRAPRKKGGNRSALVEP